MPLGRIPAFPLTIPLFIFVFISLSLSRLPTGQRTRGLVVE